MFKNLKETLKLAIPITISQLGQTLFGVIDAIMIGKIGTVALGAVAFVNNVYNVPLIFMAGLCSAVSVLSAHHFGAKNYKQCGRLLIVSIVFLLLCSLAGSLLLASLENFLFVFQQPQEVLEESHKFYPYIIWSLIPTTLYFGLKHFTESVSRPYIGVVTVGIGLVCNIFLNYTLIYGNFGAPKMGIAGAGLATLISRCTTCLILFLYIFTSKKFKIFKPEIYSYFDKSQIKELSKIGVPSAFQYLFEVMAFAGSGIMMGWLGTQQLAAHQIALNIASLTFMVALGLSFATSVRLGQLQGQSDLVGARQTGFLSFGAITLFNTICGILMICFKDIIPQSFVNDPIVWKYAGTLLIVAALFQIFDGTQAVGVSAQRALKDVKVPTLITFSAYWLCAIPLAYYLSQHTKLNYLGIWIGLFIGLGVSSIALITRFHMLTKKLIEHQKLSLELQK